jgi:hypothetical protein
MNVRSRSRPCTLCDDTAYVQIIGGTAGPVMNSIAAPQSGKGEQILMYFGHLSLRHLTSLSNHVLFAGIPLPMAGQQCYINADGKGIRPLPQCWNGTY